MINIPRLTYDLEIVKAIPPRNDVDRLPGIEYCEGWHDHGNMGISVIGGMETDADGFQCPRVFGDFSASRFINDAASVPLLVTFNGVGFDDHVIRAEWWKAATAKGDNPELVEGVLYEFDNLPRYDLLREIWIAAGLSPEFQKGTHAGYSLDDVCYANFGLRKSGSGAMAPVLWQQGRHAEVIDYCLRDVALTDRLFVLSQTGTVTDPKTGRQLTLREAR